MVMDPMTIGAIATVGSSLIGMDQAGKDRAAADKASRNALAQYANVNIPSTDQMQLALELYQQTGQITPELEQAMALGPSAYEDISVDPRLKEQQMLALQQIAGVAENGMTTADQAALETIRRQVAGENQAKQGQILQEMQSRGQGGSGAELITRLKANQGASDQQAQMALQEAQMQQQARRQALESLLSGSTSVRGQEFNEQSEQARAKDIINQFNVQNQQSVQSRNVGSKNDAQSRNLAAQQQIADQNVQLRNQQQQYNKNLQQQQFDNQMQLAAARAGQYANRQARSDQRAGQTASMWGGIGSTVGTILAGQNKPNDVNSQVQPSVGNVTRGQNYPVK